MSFDLSRIRFDAREDFLGVVMQQGRVQLDADWNAWVAQLARRLQAGTLDTFSGNVVPRTTPEGFRVQLVNGALTIGPGRIYVDGLLAENHGGAPDAWQPALAEAVGMSALAYTAQPYYPEPPALPQAGRHLVYVDVWQRELTPLQQPGLIEQAVGVDTTGRLQTVWQVKILPNVGNASCASDDEDVPGWRAATAPSAGRLSTATGDPGDTANPCALPPAAGYRGLENQLYRVEVHTGGPLGSATFKWSRDNATVAARVTHIDAARTRITVDSIGRDDFLRFNDGDWVEISDDWRELKNLPGELRRIRVAGGVDESARTLSLESPLSAGLFPTNAQEATVASRNTRVRRWDQAGIVRREDGSAYQNLDTDGSAGILIPAAGTRLFLENGILVEFSLAAPGGQFHSGDWWVCAARAADASIERLDDAPARGIHHHYARLAMLSLPATVSDCRTLWPPEVATGHGCDCTVCVSADEHNSGRATIQQALDRIRAVGGTLCLGIGRYEIDKPLDLSEARSLRMRGQGWATLLVAREPGSLLRIADGAGVALESFSIIGSAAREGSSAMVEVTNTIDFRAEHINVLALPAGEDSSDGVGIGLSGNLLGARISHCALVAARAIARSAARDRTHLFSAELHIADNLFICSQHAVCLDEISLHFGNTRICANLMLNGAAAAIVATGAVLGGAALRIGDNVIHSMGGGILAGVSGLRIAGNEINGSGGTEEARKVAADGIVIGDGLFVAPLEDVEIHRNHLREIAGNAIRISRPLQACRIEANRIHNCGLGALVMDRDAAAAALAIHANHCEGLGLATEREKAAFAALQLIRVQRCDVTENTVATVAPESTAAAAIDGLFAAAIDQLRIRGNRIHTIGPVRSGGELGGLRVVVPSERVVIADNHLERSGDPARKVASAPWCALRIGSGTSGDAQRVAPAHYFTNDDRSFLLTTTAVALKAARPGEAAIQDNQLRGDESLLPLMLCNGVSHCLFSGNHGESRRARAKDAHVGEIAARTINASNNRLIGTGDVPTLLLRPQEKFAIVIGNTSSARIDVAGAPLPNDLLLTNFIGV